MQSFANVGVQLSQYFLICKVSKPNAKSSTLESPDGSLILFDMQKLELNDRFIKRTFNLPTNSNTKS